MAAALFCFVALLSSSAQPAFQPIQPITNGIGNRVRLTVPASTFARIDASTNLLDWNGYLTAGAGSLVHTDLFTTFPNRFYRAETVTNAGTFAGDHFPTANGDVIIRPVNHAGFIMKWNGKMIYNDPSGGSFGAFPKADLILIGHDHSDHFNLTALAGVKGTNCVIIAPQVVYNALGSLKTIATVLRNGDFTNFYGIDILAVPSYDFDGQHNKGVGNGYVLTMGGRKFYMAGDTDDIPETRALTGIDVAFMPMNSFTMTPLQAASVVKAFQPKFVYPYHYTDAINPITFRNAMTNTPSIEVRLRNWY